MKKILLTITLFLVLLISSCTLPINNSFINDFNQNTNYKYDFNKSYVIYSGYSKEENIYAYLYNSSTFVVLAPQADYNAYNIKHIIEDQGISLSTTRGLVPNVAVYYFDIYDGEYELKEIWSEGPLYNIFGYTLKPGCEANLDFVNFLINEKGFENDPTYFKKEEDWGYKYYLKNNNFEIHMYEDEYIRIKKIK